MKKMIERKQARKNWSNPMKNILLRRLFITFENYWKACEEFNLLTDNDKHKYITEATKTIKRIKTENTLRRLDLIKG